MKIRKLRTFTQKIIIKAIKRQITYNSLIYNSQIKQIIKLLTFRIYTCPTWAHSYGNKKNIVLLYTCTGYTRFKFQDPDTIRGVNRINIASHK